MIKAYKKTGQTPLELINELKKQNPDLKNQSLSYAGRLDPMAEGQMIIMVGDRENKNRPKFLSFNKLYEADILVGFSTDSYDALGLINSKTEKISPARVTVENIKNALIKIKKLKKIKYPVFSSKTVAGKPLWQWKKEGQINQIEIPSRTIQIKKIKIIKNQMILGDELSNYIINTINKVNGDFRQKEIINLWKKNVLDQKTYQVIKIKIKVTSGTYIRSLVNELSKELNIPCCLLKLKRTKIYNNSISNFFAKFYYYFIKN